MWSCKKLETIALVYSKASPSSSPETLEEHTLGLRAEGCWTQLARFHFPFSAAALGDFIAPFCDCQSTCEKDFGQKVDTLHYAPTASSLSPKILKVLGRYRESEQNISGQELCLCWRSPTQAQSQVNSVLRLQLLCDVTDHLIKAWRKRGRQNQKVRKVCESRAHNSHWKISNPSSQVCASSKHSMGESGYWWLRTGTVYQR